MLRTALLFCSLILWTGVSFAQQANTSQPFANRQSTLGGGLELNAPLGEFNDVWGRNFWGFGANFTYPGRVLPFDYGFDFGLAYMGSKGARVLADDANGTVSEGELTVKSRMFSYLGEVRLRPINGRVSPYVEGVFGARQFTTTSAIEFEGADQPADFDRKANSWTGTYGWAVGALVGFGKQFYVEGRVMRLWGGRVGYIDANNVDIRTDGTVAINTLSSETDCLQIRLGCGLRF